VASGRAAYACVAGRLAGDGGSAPGGGWRAAGDAVWAAGRGRGRGRGRSRGGAVLNYPADVFVCGLGAFVRPGGVFPARLADAGDSDADGVAVADAPAFGEGFFVGVSVPDGVIVTPGVPPVPGCPAEPPAWAAALPVPGEPAGCAVPCPCRPAPPVEWASCFAGAAHWVNGACGPPVIATTTATRQPASTPPAPMPAIRSSRWRLPDGSANTGPDSTPGVYRSSGFPRP
jgi:hypothetical protein